MSDLNLDNIVGFKAVDKDGNEQNVTVDEMVDMVSNKNGYGLCQKLQHLQPLLQQEMTCMKMNFRL